MSAKITITKKGGTAKEYALPKGFKFSAYAPASAASFAALTASRGRAAWGALHLKALQHAITPAWLATTWRAMVPHGGCACLKKLDDFLLKTPFRPGDQFAWSVDLHNAVNAALGKPAMAASSALAIWSKG